MKPLNPQPPPQSLPSSQGKRHVVSWKSYERQNCHLPAKIVLPELLPQAPKTGKPATNPIDINPKNPKKTLNPVLKFRVRR